MTRFPARRTFAALLLGLSLVAASASALEPRLRPEPGTEPLAIEPMRKLLDGLGHSSPASGTRTEAA